MDNKSSIDNYQSIKEIIETQTTRKNNLDQMISLVHDQKFLKEDINTAFRLIQKISGHIKIAQKELQVSREYSEKFAQLEAEAEDLEVTMAHMETNLPARFNRLAVVEETFENNFNIQDENVDYENIPTTPGLPIKRHLDFAENTLISHSAQKTTANTEIQYLTQSEFMKIPSYMRGRVTYDVLNAFIDKINSCVQEKYALLRLPASSTKRRANIDKYNNYKRQECPGTKGKRFITQDDLKEVMGGKLDKHTLNLLPMLRHTSRLQELREGGLIRYVALTN